MYTFNFPSGIIFPLPEEFPLTFFIAQICWNKFIFINVKEFFNESRGIKQTHICTSLTQLPENQLSHTRQEIKRLFLEREKKREADIRAPN